MSLKWWAAPMETSFVSFVLTRHNNMAKAWTLVTMNIMTKLVWKQMRVHNALMHHPYAAQDMTTIVTSATVS
jgi:hypothetical protein